VWAKHRLKPHRLGRYLASNDPQFESKAADIIGLYINPPQHVAVFSVDEKTAIQALDRKDPVLPLSPGRAERHGFEYFRHGTLSLYAAFNTRTGEILGKTASRHSSAEFVDFLADLIASQPKRKEIHLIADNLGRRTTITRVRAGHVEYVEILARIPLHRNENRARWQVATVLRLMRDLINFVAGRQAALDSQTHRPTLAPGTAPDGQQITPAQRRFGGRAA